jgi:hypothetical protein
MNYTYLNRDIITHSLLNPNFVHLEHQDFSHQIKNANAKGLITHVIDQCREGAPNYTQGYSDRVEHHLYNKRQ